MPEMVGPSIVIFWSDSVRQTIARMRYHSEDSIPLVIPPQECRFRKIDRNMDESRGRVLDPAGELTGGFADVVRDQGRISE